MGSYSCFCQLVKPESETRTRLNMNTKESLAAIGRSKLIQLAIENGVPSASAYSTKSAVLIDLIIAKTSASVAVADAPLEVESSPVADNIVPFGIEPVQTELKADATKKAVSVGIFKLNRKVFQGQLNAAVKVIDRNASMPILKNVCLSFGAGRMRVDGTNLDVYISTESPIESDGEAQLSVPAHLLTKFVSKCSSEFMMVEVFDSHLFVISDMANRTELMGIDAKEFPAFPFKASSSLFTIDGKNLVRAMNDAEKC